MRQLLERFSLHKSFRDVAGISELALTRAERRFGGQLGPCMRAFLCLGVFLVGFLTCLHCTPWHQRTTRGVEGFREGSDAYAKSYTAGTQAGVPSRCPEKMSKCLTPASRLSALRALLRS